ncbi:winged helix-turn-helix domain-containing protein [Marinicella meishanensis]|uniref:winged helix-turn-helix domain-containing protein n=1 Tax=Marinicella meishanensis TaxID=2873263 RepID=UPI001CC05994|nr:crosslink repair DNA glycosylase YcaQ family protein [Marinicella sp. NBU2979]
MKTITRQADRQRLRHLVLQAQGLLQTQPFGRGVSGTLKAIEHLGYVQLDTISVVQRAHHHVLQARVPGYQTGMAEKLLTQGQIFEHWSHAAAFLPMRDFRFSLPYKQAIKSGQTHWFKNPDKKLMTELLDRVRLAGPLQAKDIEQPRPKGRASAGWWDWKPAKKALEQLYMQGDLMVCDRAGFQKTYDLTERVLPAAVDTRTPEAMELAVHLLDQQLRCQGVVSYPSLTYLRRIPGLREAMADLLTQRVADAELLPLSVADQVHYVLPEVWESKLPRSRHRLTILSPFDNSLIQRERLARLFGFDYQIECYVPAAKRRHGYFSLPLLYRDRFIGRMDCKAHRDTGLFAIKHLHFENHRFDAAQVIDALAQALPEFLRFQACDHLCVNRVEPTPLQGPVELALAHLE